MVMVFVVKEEKEDDVVEEEEEEELRGRSGGESTEKHSHAAICGLFCLRFRA